MIFTETPLAGAFVIDIEPIEDERGFFARTFCAEDFAARA
jgi:dTDP-4-dehydrorhamnose 3,5-epimerase